MIEKTLVRILRIELKAYRQLYAMKYLKKLFKLYPSFTSLSPVIFEQLIFRKDKYHKTEKPDISKDFEDYRL